jgi:hypothetical protein
MVNEFLKIYLPRSGAGIDTPYKRYRFWHAPPRRRRMQKFSTLKSAALVCRWIKFIGGFKLSGFKEEFSRRYR